MFRNRLFVAVLAVTVAPAAFAAPDAPKKDAPKKEEPKKEAPAEPSTEPEGVPLELRIVRENKENKDPIEYHTGDPDHMFRQKVVEAELKGNPLRGTFVELFMEIKNTGPKPLTVYVSGDVTLLTLDLQGKGAMTAEKKHAPLKDTIPPTAVTILPGKTYIMPLNTLDHGVRNEEKHAYIAKGGNYTLTATFKTGVSPAPKGTRFLPKGFGEVILKSPPFKFLAVKPS